MLAFVHLGDELSGRTVRAVEARDDIPLLIVGREFAVPTLHRLALDDIKAGRGLAFFGDAAALLPYIPPGRVQDVILFELDYDWPIPFNPLEKVPPEKRAEIAGHVLETFKTVWDYDAPTPQFDMYLRTAALAMLSLDKGTLFALYYLFTSDTYRASVIGQLKDTFLKSHWAYFDGLEERDRNNRAVSVLNRLTAINADIGLRHVIGQHTSFPLKDTDVLLVQLPEGDTSALLAGLLQCRVKGRVYVERPLIFVGPGSPVIAADYLDQLPGKLRGQMLGTADLMCFRLGVQDARLLEPQFDIKEQGFNLSDLEPMDAFVRTDRTYQVSMPKREYRVYEHSERKIRERSRKRYARARSEVEAAIASFIEKNT